MNILITGATGFIGKNLSQWLKFARPDDNLYLLDIHNTDKLESYCQKADFVFHLAGVNRPDDTAEFERGNVDFTKRLFDYLSVDKMPHVVMSSSIQATLDNPYGKSKLAAEKAAHDYGNASIFRLPGVFGKWCRPNYNSVVATFCHNIANGLPISISDDNYLLELVYIDDVCEAFIDTIENNARNKIQKNREFCEVSPTYSITLGQLANTIRCFGESRQNLYIPNLADELTGKLYSTYQSYLPYFGYELLSHKDDRGEFAEILKSRYMGQVSVNITKPGITKGNHYHHTKTEKFLVVSGAGIICLRKIGEKEEIKYSVSSDHLTVIDIPPGCTHSITNIGNTDLVTVMWANETYDPNRSDTYFENVEINENT